MDSTTAALLGTAIGAMTTLAVTEVTSVLQRKHDRRRERLTNVARVAQALAALQVGMEWIAWLGTHQPQYLDDDAINDYAGNAMPRFPALLGAGCLLAGHNGKVYQQFLALYQDALAIDEHITQALNVNDEREWDEHDCQQFRACLGQAEQFFDAWRRQVTAALGRC